MSLNKTSVAEQSRKLSYFDEYEKLMGDKGFLILSRLLEGSRLIVGHEYSDFCKKTHKGLAYHALTIDTEKSPASYGAFLHITYIEANEMEGLIDPDFGALPFMMIVFPSKIDSRADGYHSFEVTLEHELMHLNDLKKLFGTDPGFIQRSICYAMANIKAAAIVSDEDIEKCIHYEVEKVFYLEPQAMKYDFDAGETRIPIPFLFSMIDYKCQSDSEYVQMKLHQYLSAIKSEIYSFVKEKGLRLDGINSAFFKALNLYGKSVFGEDAGACYKEFSDNWVLRVMDRAMENSPKP